ncbi:MAG TPA: HAD hydrolase-like protein [Longimicrobiales bacterium]
MKLVLFDIDGTLLSTDGAARDAFHAALLEVYGTAGPIETHSFAGKTDPQIARELLTAADLPGGAIDAGLGDLWTGYLTRLERALANGARPRVMPGVVELLERLATMQDRVTVALLTGNIVEGARIKLDAAGLWRHFRFGAYGSDSEQRDELPAIAVARAREVRGHTFAGRDVIVLGDTPSDVSCGRGIGCRAAAVATGPFDGATLHDAGADVVWDTLEDTDTVVDWLVR